MKKCIGLVSANYSIEGFQVISESRAMAAVPFGGRYRLIDFPLSNLSNAGITTAGIITPGNSRSLVEHVGTGKEWGFGRKAGGLFFLPGTMYGERNQNSRFMLRDLEKNSRFLEVGNSDYIILCGSNEIYNIDLAALLEHKEKSPAKCTLVYKKMLADEGEKSFYLDINEQGAVRNISTRGKGVVNRFLDCAIFDMDFLRGLLERYSALEDMDVIEIIAGFIKKFDVDSFEFTGYAAIINNASNYMTASMDLLDVDIRRELFNKDRKIYTAVQDRAPTRYGPEARVKNSLIAGGCVIDGTVENSIVFRSSVIGKGAVIKNSILMQHSEIGNKASVENAMLDKNVTINEGVIIAGGTAQPFIIEKGRVL